MRILVTGSDGMVGSHLVPVLKENHDVLCFGDDKDIRSWDDWCSFHDDDKPIDMIIHLAALAGVRSSIDDPELYYDVNVNGTENMIEFSNLDGSKILYASSSNAKEWWTNPYGATKKMNELQCKYYDAIGMRFHTIWPGRDDMLFRKLQRKDVTYINRKHYRDFVHIDDVISAIQKLINNFDVAIMMQTVYDIGTGHSTPVEQVAQIMGYEGEYIDDLPKTERVSTKADIEALLRLGYTPQRNILNYENIDNGASG